MRRAAAVPGYDSFYFFFNETDGENSAVDPIFSAPPGLAGGDGRLPHPMTSILRTGVGQFGAGVRLASPRGPFLCIGHFFRRTNCRLHRRTAAGYASTS